MPVIVNRSISANCLKICAGDMNRKASLELRTIVPPKMGQTKSTMSFTTVSKFWCKVNTISGSKRFAGVVTEDKTTHMFITRWTPSIDKLDGDGEHFIKMINKRNGKTTLYRVEGIGDHNEQNNWVAFICSERGLDGNEEADA